MAGKHLVAPPPRFRSLGSLPAAPARKAPLRRPILYWPAVALAAAAGALLVSGVTLSVALFAARTAKPARVALAQPPASEPAASVPVDATVLQDAAPSLAPRALAVPYLTPVTPDPVPPPSQGGEVSRDDPPAPAPARPLDPPAAAPTLAPAAPTCQTFGTSVAFAASPAAAQQQAARDGKLVFLLHVSGDFEDDAFT